jgi:hypothetical protein
MILNIKKYKTFSLILFNKPKINFLIKIIQFNKMKLILIPLTLTLMALITCSPCDNDFHYYQRGVENKIEKVNGIISNVQNDILHYKDDDAENPIPLTYTYKTVRCATLLSCIITILDQNDVKYEFHFYFDTDDCPGKLKKFIAGECKTSYKLESKSNGTGTLNFDLENNKIIHDSIEFKFVKMMFIDGNFIYIKNTNNELKLSWTYFQLANTEPQAMKCLNYYSNVFSNYGTDMTTCEGETFIFWGIIDNIPDIAIQEHNGSNRSKVNYSPQHANLDSGKISGIEDGKINIEVHDQPLKSKDYFFYTFTYNESDSNPNALSVKVFFNNPSDKDQEIDRMELHFIMPKYCKKTLIGLLQKNETCYKKRRITGVNLIAKPDQKVKNIYLLYTNASKIVTIDNWLINNTKRLILKNPMISLSGHNIINIKGKCISGDLFYENIEFNFVKEHPCARIFETIANNFLRIPNQNDNKQDAARLMVGSSDVIKENKRFKRRTNK